MKITEKRRSLKLVPAQMKLTDDEILADLVYPAPLFDGDEDRIRERERDASN